MILVSIIVPNFNHREFLPSRLDSIFNQTFQDFEVILLDDSSNDNSYDFLIQFLDHPKVSVVHRNTPNSGSPFGLWEVGFKLAKGEFIWIAESDDLTSEKFLETLVPFFLNKSTVLVHCKSYQFSNSTNDLKLNSWWDNFYPNIWTDSFIKNGKFILERYGRFKCPVINVSSCIFRKSSIFDIKLPNKFKYTGDWYFWGQLFLKGDVAFISQPLNFIRIHDNSATSNLKSNLWQKLIENINTIKEINRSLNYKTSYENNYYWFLKLWKNQLHSDFILGMFYTFKFLPFSFILNLISMK